jgi:signal transduction histidine kinase
VNKVKLILSVVVVSVLFLGGIYTRLEELLFADRLDQMELQIKNQVSSLVLAYHADAKFLQKWVYAVNEDGTRKINWNSMSPYFAVAQLNSKLQVIEWSFREKSPVSTLSKENLTQLINSFHVKLADKEVKYLIYSDPDKKKIFLTLLPQGEKLWVFASLGENLQSIMDAQKTSPYMLTLINSEFTSLANIKSEYIGKKIFENKIISEIKKGSKATASGSFAISSGEEFFAFYEKVPEQDMYVYSQASLGELISNKNSIKNQFIIFSIGFLIIISSLLMILSRKEQEPIGFTNKETSARGTVNNQAAKSFDETVTNTNITNPNTQESQEKVKMEGYMKIASVIGNEIKNPIVKILNLTSAVLSQTNNQVDKESLKNIQTEIRAAKDVVDKLLVFAGDRNSDRIETKIDTPILRALKNLDVQFSLKSIKIEKNMQEVAKIPMDVNKMSAVFENILKNSIQSMERKPGKVINIKSYQKDNSVFVEISDNGDGIDKENINKIFDPFYTTMGQAKNIGLGLSMALGIVKDHQGKISVESEKGKGTKMIIELPLPHAVAASKPEKVTVVVKHEEALSPLKETPVKEVAVVEMAPTLNVPQLNVPKVAEIDVMAQLADSVSESSEEENLNSEEEVVEIAAEEDDGMVLQGMVPDETPVASIEPIKPLNLNVNVDELFDMQDEEIPAVPAMPKSTDTESKPVTNLIVPPKPSVKKQQTKESENFKVLIRKPKGGG